MSGLWWYVQGTAEQLHKGEDISEISSVLNMHSTYLNYFHIYKIYHIVLSLILFTSGSNSADVIYFVELSFSGSWPTDYDLSTVPICQGTHYKELAVLKHEQFWTGMSAGNYEHGENQDCLQSMLTQTNKRTNLFPYMLHFNQLLKMKVPEWFSWHSTAVLCGSSFYSTILFSAVSFFWRIIHRKIFREPQMM